jgi:hypothetical protein
MNGSSRLPSALLLASALLAACGSGDDESQAPPTFLEGDWTSCTTETIAPYGTFDVRARLSFSGDRYQYEALLYGTSTNGTCAGTGFLVDSGQGSFAVGANVPASLGATPVTARAIDLMENQGGGQSTPLYTIAYVDAAPEPDIAYTNLTGMATTPQARPTTLEEGRPFRKQP